MKVVKRQKRCIQKKHICNSRIQWNWRETLKTVTYKKYCTGTCVQVRRQQPFYINMYFCKLGHRLQRTRKVYTVHSICFLMRRRCSEGSWTVWAWGSCWPLSPFTSWRLPLTTWGGSSAASYSSRSNHLFWNRHEKQIFFANNRNSTICRNECLEIYKQNINEV